MRSTLAEADVAEQLGRGPVVVIVGRANLAEPQEWTTHALGGGPGRGARGHGPPGAAPRQRPRRARRGAHPGRGWPGHGRHPRCRRQRPHRLPRPARRRSAGRRPRRGAGPTRGLEGARTVIAVDTHLTGSAAQADLVLPAAAFAEKTGTTTNLEGRVSALSQKVTRAGLGTGRLDHRRRAGVVARGRPRREHGRGGARPARRLRARVRAGVGGRVWPRTGTASSSRSRRPACADVPTPTVTPALLLRSPSRGQPDALRRGRGRRRLAVARPAGPGRAPPRPPARPRPPRRHDGDRAKVSSASASLVLEVEADPGVARGTALAALQPAVVDRRRPARLDRAASSTSASRT